MKNIAIVVHGGAGPDSEFIRENIDGYKAGLTEAANTAYAILASNGTAEDAVEAAIMNLEDNPLFNSGRGSALNAKAEIEMGASLMCGKTRKSGAVAIVKEVKNPIALARAVMDQTEHIYLGAEGALNFARSIDAVLKPEAYFITDHQYKEYTDKKKESEQSTSVKEQVESEAHGTVGAVALDAFGNIAAGTSTGGSACCKEGRISDSSMIGCGTFADNDTCAVSCTGDGEYIMRATVASTISNMVKYRNTPLAAACKEVVLVENKGIDGDIGVIALNKFGDIGIAFNSERMHRAWKNSEGETQVKIYKD